MAGQQLTGTALVNEAYLRLVDVQHVNQRIAHFLAMSARLMQRPVDYALEGVSSVPCCW